MNDKLFNKEERVASWKIILPLEAKLILAGNIPIATRKSLMRSFELVNAADGIADICIAEKISACEISDIIEKKYQTIVLCQCPEARKLLHENAYHIEEYAAIPPFKPRLFISLKNIHSILSGLNFHIPGSFKAKLATCILKLLARIGLIFPLRKNTVLIASRDKISSNKLFDFIEDKLGQKPDFINIYTGSEIIKRKITVLAEFESRSPVIIKIADTSEGMKAIQKESSTLKMLAGTHFKKTVPEVLFESSCFGYYIQAQSLLMNDKKAFSSFMAEGAVMKLVIELNKINQQNIKLGELPLYQEMKKQHFNSEKVNKLLQYLETKENIISPCGLVHGDFAQWNIKSCGDEVFIYDWEDAIECAPLSIDVFHYFFRKASLIGKWRGADRLFDKINGKLKTVMFQESLLPNLCLCVVREYSLSKRRKHIDEFCEVLLNRIEH